MLYIFRKIFGDKYDRHMKKPMRFYTNPISEECWNLDDNFIEFIIPRLKLFRKEASAIIEYDFTIVDRIVEGFEVYRSKYDWTIENAQENMDKAQAAMDLFAKHWMEFWW